MRTGSKTIMNVIAAAVLGIVSLLGLLGMSIAAVGALDVNVSEPYGEVLEVVDGNPNSVQQSSNDATSLLQPAAEAE